MLVDRGTKHVQTVRRARRIFDLRDEQLMSTPSDTAGHDYSYLRRAAAMQLQFVQLQHQN